MPWLPYQRFSIDSALPAAEACSRLAAAVEPARLFRFGSGACPFEGRVEGQRFAIQRIIRYRNSFLPRIRGAVEPTATGSRLSGTLALHPLVITFCVVWCGMVVMIGIPLSLDPGDAPSWGRAMPVGFLLFLWAMSTAAFTFEARKALALLAGLLSGPPPRG